MVLPTESHGWRSLAARVQGGGIINAYEAELPFDGRRYPVSAANPPSRPLPAGVRGKVLVPVGAEGRALP